MGFKRYRISVFLRLFLAWFFIILVALVLLNLVVGPFGRWLFADAAWESSLSWEEFLRILGYSAGFAVPASLLLWLEGLFNGRW